MQYPTKRALAAVLLFFGFLLPSVAQGRDRSTEQERNRLLTVAAALERDPLNPALQDDRNWAKDFVITVPDIEVTFCASVMGPLSYNTDYKYKKLLQDVNLFGEAAFAIRYPDQARVLPELAFAGMDAMLAAYGSLIERDPGARWRELDRLLALRTRGQLKQHIRSLKDKCGDQSFSERKSNELL